MQRIMLSWSRHDYAPRRRRRRDDVPLLPQLLKVLLCTTMSILLRVVVLEDVVGCGSD